jgi:hypothetical protein
LLHSEAIRSRARRYPPLEITELADYFLSQVRELVASAQTPVARVLIDAEGMVDIDVTALEVLDTSSES